jgi:hypothetical protein
MVLTIAAVECAAQRSPPDGSTGDVLVRYQAQASKKRRGWLAEAAWQLSVPFSVVRLGIETVMAGLDDGPPMVGIRPKKQRPEPLCCSIAVISSFMGRLSFQARMHASSNHSALLLPSPSGSYYGVHTCTWVAAAIG